MAMRSWCASKTTDRDSEQPARAFDPFYTTKPVGAGTGLGLALVHRFVQEFGGSVAVENRATGGARIIMRLRSAPASLAAERGSRPAVALPDSSFALAETQESPRTRRRVLVVDDESALREVQRRMLARLEVWTHLSPPLGRTHAQRCSMLEFDVVVTDLRMPGAVSGADLVAWLARKRRRSPSERSW